MVDIYDEYYVRSWYIFLFCNALILGFPCCFRSYSKTASGLRSKVKKMLDKKALLGTPSTTGSFENILLYNRIPYLNSLGLRCNCSKHIHDILKVESFFVIYLKWNPSIGLFFSLPSICLLFFSYKKIGDG